MSGARRRILIVNPSDGGLLYWLARLYAFAALGALAMALFAAGGVYVWFASQVPPVPDLASYADQAPGVTTLLGMDGSIIAELSRERREVVPLDRVPPKMIDAFVATEDRRFFEHAGIDLRGLLRAFLVNLRAGEVAQGGSTITQQVAKSYLSSVRSYSRKLKEAILARRIEARYSKRAILALYLNQIFLGNGAYGVQAAARRYFDKDVSELDLGEMAMIAGLARAPSRDSPLVDLGAAMARREQVLANMAAIGSITVEEAREWAKKPLNVRPRRDYFHEVAPYFAEHVRRELVKKYGQQGVYESGLRVETTVLPALDVLAAENVDVATRKLDKRQGFRGPEAHLGPDLAKIFRARSKALYGDERLVEDKLYLGLVEEVGAAEAKVRIGERLYPLPVDKMRWAARYSAEDATNDKQIEAASDALRKGDVIWVRWAFRSRVPRFSEFNYNEEGDAVWLPEQPERKPPPGPQVLLLEQQPRVSGSLFTFDHHDGYVLAMAGGDDFDQSEFNRVVQSCRQPGSAYKPIYYSLALDRGYAFDSEWNDKPKAEVDPVTGELWVPQNIDGTYSVRVTLEKALVWSKNPPSVEIFETLGAKDVEKWARRFGFTTPIHADKALALGASCIRTDEMSRAFAVFARGGRSVDNVYVRRVLDRRGRVLEDHTAWDDPLLEPAARLDRIAATWGDEPEPVIPPRTAFLTTNLLRKIVTLGHSGPIRAIKIPAAGKTGTSSHTSDVWFVGFTSRWLTTAWLGDDTYERQLGYKDASFMLSVPMWARYMYVATDGQPLEEIPWERPPGVKERDTGGPLKPGFPPPPPPGYDAGGHPYQLPAKLQGTVMTSPTPPENLVRQKVVRVPGGAPVPPRPVPNAPAD
jgi:penicillin-binding protein 1A